MGKFFGSLPDGKTASLYTIRWGKLTAEVTDFGATLVSLYVPDKQGCLADVILGYDDCSGYAAGDAFLGAIVGRNANRVGGASFVQGNTTVVLGNNDKGNNLHSGPDYFHTRLWRAEQTCENAITFCLHSPHGDQGFPGNADIRVRYELKAPGMLEITYDALSDRDTVFNMTSHAYFNLAGHQHPELAMGQTLCMPARFFNPDDAANIPTGEFRGVCGTPMDFRAPKPLGQDIGADYEPLHLQGGYDHNFEVFCNPCAVLHDPVSGRSMAVITDCPGIQVYTANFTNETGKGGQVYPPRSGVCLETQFYPDAVNHPEWPQPIVRAGERYHSVTAYRFF